VRVLCSLLRITRDAYYKRLSRSSSSSNKREVVLKLVKNLRVDQKRIGTRKLHHEISPELKSLGLSIGRDKLFTVLREERLLVKQKKRFDKTTYSKHSYAVAPNRLKNVSPMGPNEAFVSDITYIRLRSGFAYLFLITDAFSRKIIGHHLSRDLGHHSAILALEMATRDIADTRGIIHHSDRGCQYCCHDFLASLREYGMIPSMTDDNHCYQNAIAERVNGILKIEFDMDGVFDSFEQAKKHLLRSVDIYNHKRIHWSLQLKTPHEIHREAA